MLRRIASPMGIDFHQCSTSDPEAFAKALKPNTKVCSLALIVESLLTLVTKIVWIESPTNPLLQVSCLVC